MTVLIMEDYSAWNWNDFVIGQTDCVKFLSGYVLDICLCTEKSLRYTKLIVYTGIGNIWFFLHRNYGTQKYLNADRFLYYGSQPYFKTAKVLEICMCLMACVNQSEIV